MQLQELILFYGRVLVEETVGAAVVGLWLFRAMWIQSRVSHTQFLRVLRRLSAACGLQRARKNPSSQKLGPFSTAEG